MKSSVVRKEIHEYVDQADQRFLALVHSMVQAEKEIQDQKEQHLRQEMIRRAELSERAIAEGNTISAKDFNTEFEQWKQKKRASIK